MSTYPRAAKITLQTDRTVKVTLGRPKAYYSRAYSQQLAAGITSVRVDFATPLRDTNWVFGGMPMIVNTGDAETDLQHIQVIGVSNPSQSGFNVVLSVAPLTANYYLHWSIAEKYNP